jgi:hypothetical protein
VEIFRVGVAPRALPLLPPNASIMEEFAAFRHILAGFESGRESLGLRQHDWFDVGGLERKGRNLLGTADAL